MNAPWTALRRLWQDGREELKVFRALDRDSADLRGRHLATVQRLTPAMALANLANAVLVAGAFQGSVAPAVLAAWLAAVLGGCAFAAHSWWRGRQRPPRPASPRAVHRLVVGSAALALLWAWPVLSWFPQGDAEQRLLLGVLTVGMLCGGAFAMATVPQAALAYLAVLGLGAAGALLREPRPLTPHLVGLLLVYVGVLAGVVLHTARAFTARLRAEREAARQGQLLGLLLRDFEEHATDLLWEVDADGRFRHVTARLAEALGCSAERLQAMTLQQALRVNADRATPLPAEQRQALATLDEALARGVPFRDLVVPVVTPAALRWWSITAKPLVDDRGHDAGWRGVIADVSAAREAHQRLAFLAHFDSLTGLANRVKLRESLARALARAERDPNRRAALICLDVDHFKAINDSLGHAAGDAVLAATAQRLKDCLRPGDLPARLGGDEFALLITDLGPDPQDDGPLHALCQRLVDTLCQPCEVDGRAVLVGVSLGVAVAPAQGRGIDELMAHADLALYAAKEAGRGRYACYVPRLGDRHRRRLQLESGLREALQRDQLRLHWQPRIDIASWQVVAAEALLRWQHPELGLVSPAEFIPVAEQAGLIDEIGAWVLAQACREARELPGGMTVSVNVSPAQLRREDFAQGVALALQAAGLPAQRLEIEITESLLVDASALVLRHLHTLRDAGLRVALDDFGTGYSSLAYLRRFPFDTLKIDRSFVREVLTRQDARAIIGTIIALARTLGMHTLAEGVEEPAQLAALREAGCDAIQGYLVARPMPLDALRRLLANWSASPAPAQAPAGRSAAPAGADFAPTTRPLPLLPGHRDAA